MLIGRVVPGRHAAPLLAQSGVPKEHLRAAWQLIDAAKAGQLSPRDSILLLKLISLSQMGFEPTQGLVHGLADRQVPPPRFPPESSLAVDAASTLVPSPPVLPSLPSIVQGVAPAGSTTVGPRTQANQSSPAADAEDDDFGDFETADETTQPSSAVVDTQNGGAGASSDGDPDDFQAFESSSQSLGPAKSEPPKVPVPADGLATS